ASHRARRAHQEPRGVLGAGSPARGRDCPAEGVRHAGIAVATLTDLLTSKIPPHSLEAERAVLGAVLLERESLPKAIELLKPSDFYKEGHRKIFAPRMGLLELNEPVDLLTVSEELRRRGELEEAGGPAALAGLVDEAA